MCRVRGRTLEQSWNRANEETEARVPKKTLTVVGEVSGEDSRRESLVRSEEKGIIGELGGKGIIGKVGGEELLTRSKVTVDEDMPGTVPCSVSLPHYPTMYLTTIPGYHASVPTGGVSVIGPLGGARLPGSAHQATLFSRQREPEDIK